MSNTFYRGADCCVIVFDLTDRESYEGIDVWRNNFLESASANNRSMSQEDSENLTPIILVGNKSDLSDKYGHSRQVEHRQVVADWIESGEALEYIETSAVSYQNIEDLFEKIADHANDY